MATALLERVRRGQSSAVSDLSIVVHAIGVRTESESTFSRMRVDTDDEDAAKQLYVSTHPVAAA
jgi:hypothetical protein